MSARFPDPVYADTVLRPLFDGAKTHHAEAFRRIDRAHLVMLAETGILPAAKAALIAEALDEVAAEADPASLTYTGEVEDYFFHVETRLKARLGPDAAGALHTARSRNDIDHTIFRIALKHHLDDIMARARALAAALIAKARAEAGTLIVAYTHGQPAQPSTFGHYLGAAAEILLRDTARLEAARAVVDLSPMGAAAITTSGFPISRERVAHLLGFAGPVRNSYGAIACADYITSVYSALSLMFLHLGRPIQDFQVWSGFETGQLNVGDAFVQISSIMPQKRNPVAVEHLRHLCSQAFARAGAMLPLIHNTPFTDMNDSEGATQEMGYEAFAAARRALDLLTALLPALSIDSARVARNISRACVTITELADTLVRREDISFRQAHEIAASLARDIVARGADLERDGEAPFRAAFRAAMNRDTALSAAEYAEAVSPLAFVARRARFGGPAPAALEEAFAAYDAELARLSDNARAARAFEAACARELTERFAALKDAV